MTLAHPERRPAVVTGASSGIGAATALALAAAGHPVVLGARRLERCEETAEKIRAAGGEAAAAHLDVADAASIEAFAAAAVGAFGSVEVLISNAGDVHPYSTLDTPPDAFAGHIDVNLLASQRLVSCLLPAMVERRRGDVVFVTSDVVRLPRTRMSSYVTAKWGLEGLARAMQLELEGTGVRASIVRPGPTATGMGMGWPGEVLDPLMAEWGRHGLFRHGGYLTPEGVAGAVVAVVTAPRGTHLTLVEVEPEAPVEEP